VTECPRCHQPVDHTPMSTAELLGVIDAALLAAAVDPDPWRVVEVVAARCRGSAQRAEGARLAIRLLMMFGARRAWRLVTDQYAAEVETAELNGLLDLPAAEGPDR
jgi:hypothetical protein